VFTVLPAAAKKIASTKTTQGFFAVVKKKVFDLDKVLSEGKKFIFLENIADPGNLGTIIRTADAFGFSGVFVSKGSADVFLDKTLRSSMGSIFNIPVIDNISSKELFERVKMFGVSAYAASLSASKDLRDLKIAKKAMICVGNESKGLSGDVLGACDECFKVAMAGKIQSLNAAVAASIIMFEVSKPKSLARS
jgi:TrmH family RNA methyltransferase